MKRVSGTSKAGSHPQPVDDVATALSQGRAWLMQAQPEQALSSANKVLALRADSPLAWEIRANALAQLRQLEQAVAAFDQALALQPDKADLHAGRSMVLAELKRFDEALAACEQALALRPDHVDAQANRAIVLAQLYRFDEALASAHSALSLRPADVAVYVNLGNLLHEMRRLGDAANCYEQALALRPDAPFLPGLLLAVRMKMCDWRSFSPSQRRLARDISDSAEVAAPFNVLSVLDDPGLQLKAAGIFATANFPKCDALGLTTRRAPDGKIRIGYYSADFYNHATAFLMVQLLEAHDSARFDIYGFSFGPAPDDEMRSRLPRAFKEFFDVRHLSDRAIAQLSRQCGIDIAVDLKGYTHNLRTGIFAHGCAPVQVNYLGYPGSMGCDFIDYVIADRTVIPPEHQGHFSEKVVYLPHSYQANDGGRRISGRVFTRGEVGLPQAGFIFCCFNNSHKILPDTFDGWMRILTAVEGSVLWLLEDNPVAANNLRREADARGVAASRLVFAGRLPLDEHLARHRLAHLFIDTFPYNAHTTASDALWAGLPVLTRMGDSFASRVAASLLHALGLPELITRTAEDFERTAIELATDPARLAELKGRLAATRSTSPLFDGKLFARHIERAYEAMDARHRAGLAPTSITIEPAPQDARVHLDRAHALQAAGHAAQALARYDMAIALDPGHAAAHFGRANALQALRRLDEALASLDEALRLRPDHADAFLNRGNVLLGLGRLQEAVASYDRALALQPQSANAYNNRGNVLREMGLWDEAVRSYQQALALNPAFEFLEGTCLSTRMKVCDWDGFEESAGRLEAGVLRGEVSAMPFMALSLFDNPAAHRMASADYARKKHPRSSALGPFGPRAPNGKIRIGYYSADYRNHPIAILIAEMLESHDRGRFELYGFSYGPRVQDEMQQRVSRSFHRFIDIRAMGDRDVARLSRELGIDIAVDLTGYTLHLRTGMFAEGCAPVQVNFLGYAGTMGCDYMDYIVADPTVITPDNRAHFSEKVVQLPHCYLVTDSTRRIARRSFAREALGLPARGFVFCCFNNNHKILPETFDGWMRILKAVEGSVLWLLQDNPVAAERLRAHAQARGVAPERLVFAPRVAADEHLARQRVADLFIDTFPYTAHTTASDALWAGLPLLTRMGRSFASRVAASHLRVLGLDELVVDTQQAYEARAIEIATQPGMAQALKARLAAARPGSPLFDGKHFARCIEAAYATMHARAQAGQPPADMVIQAAAPRRVAPASDAPAPAPAAGGDAATEPALQHGLALQQRGEHRQAIAVYEALLRTQPSHLLALQLLGLAHHQAGEPQHALPLLDQAVALMPGQAAPWSNRGLVLAQLGRLDEALASYGRAIALEPDFADAHANLASTLHELGRLDEALAAYETLMALRPDDPGALHRRGIVLRRLGRAGDAVASFDQALAIHPGFADALNSRGVALKELARPDEALADYDRALALRADHAETWANRGYVLLDLNRLEEAVASYERALVLQPHRAEILHGRGVALLEMKRAEEALESFRKVASLQPDSAEAHYNCAVALKELRRAKEVVGSCDTALALKPAFPDAHVSRGNALLDLQRWDDAARSYASALALAPDFGLLLGKYLNTMTRICDWQSLASDIALLKAKIADAKLPTAPFAALSLFDDPGLHLKAAQAYAALRYPRDASLGPMAARPAGEKIKVGYYSADFHNHATLFLMLELLEAHDRERFEFYGFGFGPAPRDALGQRAARAFHRFLEVGQHSDREIAAMSRAMGIDIAVDLKGYTQNLRTGIFAAGCAPVQVNFLGYPGTMGCDYIDYIVADKTVIPPGNQQHFSEKVVYLPHSYQVNDARRVISRRAFTRAEVGLPAQGFVFCSFNNSYKILPETFDGWMRMLQAVEGSVLWLLQDNPTGAANLRREAQARGVSPDRLVFGPRMRVDEHLARHRLADLFIDTFPCNAHTTASDALWAGLPVLTRMGESFASRVAASLLHALDLPELVTRSQEDYEARAIELARDPPMLAALKARLAANRLASPLFNGSLFARHIEAAYAQMHARHCSGLPPASFEVAA